MDAAAICFAFSAVSPGLPKLFQLDPGQGQGVQIHGRALVFGFQCPLQVPDRFRRLALGHEQAGQVEVREMEIGLVPDGQTEMPCRVFGLTLLRQQIPQVVVTQGVIGVDLQGLSQRFLGLVHAAGHAQEHAEVVVGLVHARIDGHRLAVVFLHLHRVTQHDVQGGEVPVDHRVIRIDLQGLQKSGLRGPEIASVAKGDPLFQVPGGSGGEGLDRVQQRILAGRLLGRASPELDEMLPHPGSVAQVPVGQPEGVVAGPEFREQLACLPEVLDRSRQIARVGVDPPQTIVARCRAGMVPDDPLVRLTALIRPAQLPKDVRQRQARREAVGLERHGLAKRGRRSLQHSQWDPGRLPGSRPRDNDRGPADGT